VALALHFFGEATVIAKHHSLPFSFILSQTIIHLTKGYQQF